VQVRALQRIFDKSTEKLNSTEKGISAFCCFVNPVGFSSKGIGLR